MAMATTTLSASNRLSPAVTTNGSCSARSWTTVYVDPGSHRQVEPRHVALEVVGTSSFGRERVGRAGKGHCVQTVVAGWGPRGR